MNKHVVSLELAEKLRESGFPQLGLFWWGRIRKEDDYEISVTYPLSNKDQTYQDLFVAPLASELMEELPKKNKHGDFLTVHKVLEGYEVFFNSYYGGHSEQYNDNLCDALASMWLYLKQRNLLGKK